MLNESITNTIKAADAEEIDEILDMAMERRRELYPDWDMAYLAVPKGAPEGTREIYEKLLSEKNREAVRENVDSSRT